MKERKIENMNVLLVEPKKAPHEAEIGSDLKSMQKTVGGDTGRGRASPSSLTCRS